MPDTIEPSLLQIEYHNVFQNLEVTTVTGSAYAVGKI
jgi:hypothetical protein